MGLAYLGAIVAKKTVGAGQDAECGLNSTQEPESGLVYGDLESSRSSMRWSHPARSPRLSRAWEMRRRLRAVVSGS